jgi:bifunctional DNase/RNase
VGSVMCIRDRIWIDQAQAQNILAGISEKQPPRPLSHDLMVALLEVGGLHLERVVIHAIEDATFRAVLKIRRVTDEGEGESVDLDSRPSDAIALALRTGSTIWMLEEVVADASIPVDAEADAEDAADFRRFLDNTSPADLIRNLRKAQQDPAEPQAADPTDGKPEGEEPPAEPPGGGAI